jgi:ABC-type oligopeptide transport system substrate-binding subunit
MRVTASIVALLAGAALLAASVTAAPAPRGGTLRVDVTTTTRQIDPTLSFLFALTHLTHLTLLGYPDEEGEAGEAGKAGTRVQPEASPMPTVSRDGRTFTFTIRRGFRFSDGSPVTAANFAFSINRALNPKMEAYAATYVKDIVGAKDVIDGKAPTASGIRVSGNKLAITLVAPAPDFPLRIALPHFAALPLDFPITAEGVAEAPLHSAGPYYLREYVQGRSALVVRNPYWRRDLLPRRPARVDRVAFTYGLRSDAIWDRVDSNQSDIAGMSGPKTEEMVRKYGLNTRVFVRQSAGYFYLAFNNARPLFKDNPRLRQAINFAIDRPHLARQFGYLFGKRTDQLLLPGMRGYREFTIYPTRGAEVERASKLAAGNLRGGKAVLYTYTGVGVPLAEITKFNLAKIGLDLEIKTFSVPVLLERAEKRDEPFDIMIINWLVDFPDPANVFNDMLSRPMIQYESARFGPRIRAAARLSGEARYDAYAKLDRELMREDPPIAPIVIQNSRILISVDTGCFSWQPVLSHPNYAAICKLR